MNQPSQFSLLNSHPAVLSRFTSVISVCILSACVAAPQANAPTPTPTPMPMPVLAPTPVPVHSPSYPPGALYPVAVNPVGSSSTYPVPVNSEPPVKAPVSFLSQQIGNKVALQGTFAGWSGCAESTQLTKSDWVIRFVDAGRTACAYVAGGVPQGIAPPPSTLSNGLPVSIQAVVKPAPTTGKPFLQYSPQ